MIFDDVWEARELKDRMHHTARCLGHTLPGSFPEALDILKRVIPHIRGFEAMAFPDYVEMNGLEDWDRSLPALAYFTQFASAEFAIRLFLDKDPKRAMAYMSQWAEDPNPHIRRLASEGCRPRLPWAMALPKFKERYTPRGHFLRFRLRGLFPASRWLQADGENRSLCPRAV